MTKEIWKFELEINGEQAVSMPEGAEILSLQVQRGKPCIWVMVDSAARSQEQRWFKTFGTGHPIEYALGAFVGTYQLKDGDLVFHVFERAAQ